MNKTLPEFNCRKIKVNGITLNVAIEGQGKDVLMVHGFPDSHQVWRHQIPVLAKAGFRVIAPDLRGYGDSELVTGKGSYRREKVVEDLAGLLDALGVDKARVVSHDWGAVLSWYFTIAHPERVDRLVVMSVGHPASYARGGLAQKIKGYYVPILASPIGEPLLKAWDWKMFRLMTRYPQEFEHWKAEMVRPGRLYAAIGLYRENLDLVLPGQLPHVKVPVMGIWSTGDLFLARKQMVNSRDHVDADWRYEEIEGAGHWLQLDAPDRVNALLLEYLA